MRFHYSLILIVGFILSSPALNAQTLSTDTLDGHPYYLSIIEGDEKEKRDAIYVLEVLPKKEKYRMVRALYCKDSSLAFKSYHTPDLCVEWVPFKESGDRITNVGEDGSRTEVKEEDLPDSTKSVNKFCLNKFYATNNDSVQVDTIYVENKNLAYLSKIYVRKCLYVNDMKQGGEVIYYQTWELKGDCISNYKQVKMIGSWDKGLKTGEWQYYNVNGALLRIETYKKGKLKKIMNYN